MNGDDGHGVHVAVLGIKRLPAFAGADRVVEQVLERLSPNNEYTVYLLRNGAPTRSCSGNRHYVYIPALRGKYLRAPSYFFLCCVHYLVKGRYDVVHVHNSDFGIFCPLLKLKRRVRVVGTFHGDPAKRDKWSGAAKAFLRASEWIFVRACDTLTSVSAEKVLSGRTVQYIPNGTNSIDDASPITPDGENFPYRDFSLRDGEYVMFACGRLDRTKGLHHLLDAYREMKTDARLLVVGDFSHDADYSGAIECAAAVDGRVVLHKALLDRRTLYDALCRCAVFVFPSEVEGMSMMLLEAIVRSRVVVCSDIPANLAVVGTDYSFLFASQNTAALRCTLEEALTVRDDTAALRSVRARVAATYSWDRITVAYEGLYAVSERDPRLAAVKTSGPVS